MGSVGTDRNEKWPGDGIGGAVDSKQPGDRIALTVELATLQSTVAGGKLSKICAEVDRSANSCRKRDSQNCHI